MSTRASSRGLSGFVQSIPPARVAGLAFVIAIVSYRYYQDVRWRVHRSLSWWAPSPRRRPR